MSEASPPNGWWSSFFDDTYAGFGLRGDDPQVPQIVDFLMQKLELSPGMTVLDQCCGVGRLSLPLARRGVRVIGVDQSEVYVAAARREAASGGLACEFHVGDAFQFATPRRCDAAFNWFTSFGYSEDDEVNIRMLERAHDSLRPGGRFAIDFLNVPRVMSDFRPAEVHRPPDGLIVLSENVPDFSRGMIDSTWTFIHPDGRRESRPVSVRMLLPHVIIDMLRRCGFDQIELMGWIDGTPFSRASRRSIITARRGE